MIEQAAILVGGLGSRLQALGFDRPKPLLHVAGRPFVEHVAAYLASWGIRHIVLLAGYKGDLVQEEYGDKKQFGVTFSVVIEPERSGTGGALRFAEQCLDNEFLLTNGDSIHLANLSDFLVPLAPNEDGRLLLQRATETTRFGTVTMDASGRVRSFAEKHNHSTDALISSGLYILRRESIIAKVEKLPCSIERDIFPHLASQGRLTGTVRGGYFVDIGVPDSLEHAHRSLAEHVNKPGIFLAVRDLVEGRPGEESATTIKQSTFDFIGRLNLTSYRVFLIGEDNAELEAVRAKLLANNARTDACYLASRNETTDYRTLLRTAISDWGLIEGSTIVVSSSEEIARAAQCIGLTELHVSKEQLNAAVSKAIRAASKGYM